MSKVRHSGRVKKLSAAMRIVDEETRRIVMQNRIDALENDKIFETFQVGEVDEPEFVPEEVSESQSNDSEDQEKQMFDKS